MIIALDLGNKHTTLHDTKNSLTELTTIQIRGQGQYQIGLDRTKQNVIYDLLMTLGVKYQDEEFIRYCKFYSHDFSRSGCGKIDVVIPGAYGSNVRIRRIAVETVIALYVRRLVNMFRIKFYQSRFQNLRQFLDAYKFYVTVSGVTNHPFRYALKQVFQIAGIQPIFINSPHAAISYYYSKYKKQLTQPQQVCLIQFNDKGTTASVYRLQSYEQKIVQVLQHKVLKKGGYHLTKTISEYFVDKIKQEKGIDINRHGPYMGLLHCQSESAKISVIDSQDKQAYIRIPDLPDQSTFGKSLNQKLLYQILENDLNQIIKFIQEVISSNSKIKTVLFLGGSTKIQLFQQRVKKLISKYKQISSQIIKLQRQSIVQGIFALQQQQITLFDISQYKYQVIGQQNFHSKLMEIGQDIPERRDEKAKFPAGQLEFNLRVLQNGNKIAHFLLEARPSKNQFLLNFQINRNKIIWLFVRTQKGKIQLVPNLEALTLEEIQKQMEIIKTLQQF